MGEKRLQIEAKHSLRYACQVQAMKHVINNLHSYLTLRNDTRHFVT
jgi:hypothetical protein